MDVYKVFLWLPFLVLEGEAPPQAQTVKHGVNHGGSPPKNPPPRDSIPSYSKDSGCIYMEEYMSDGYPMYFYSKNLYADLMTIPGQIMVRRGQKVFFAHNSQHKLSSSKSIPDTHDDLSNPDPLTDAVMTEGGKDLKLYADYWHGNLESGHQKEYQITEEDLKPLGGNKNDGELFQISARMQATDESLEMCCNLIIHSQWMSGTDYAFLCAQPACFRLRQRKKVRPCYLLKLVPGKIDNVHYKTCLKEVPIKKPSPEQRVKNLLTAQGPTSTSNNRVPHSSSSALSSIYGTQIESKVVSFIRKNDNLDSFIHSHLMLQRSNHEISFKKETRICDEDKDCNEKHFVEMVAANHILAYADVILGDIGKKYTVFDKQTKRVQTTTSGFIHQLNAHLKSSDGHHQEMCCNLLLHATWIGQRKMVYSCAQPACFHVLKSANEIGKCSFLEIVYQIIEKDFKSCWKEV